MDTISVEHRETRVERLVAAFVEGAEERMRETRGYGLLAFERKEIEREAREYAVSA